MLGNQIVSVLIYPDYNVYRVQIARHCKDGIKIRTYTADYKDKYKVFSLLTRASTINSLVGLNLIKQRREEHGYD